MPIGSRVLLTKVFADKGFAYQVIGDKFRGKQLLVNSLFFGRLVCLFEDLQVTTEYGPVESETAVPKSSTTT